jgi:hypothetical protein
VAKVKRDIGEGYYEKGWHTRAKKATQERREGKFDEYLKEHAEDLFGEGRDQLEDQVGDADKVSSGSDWEKHNINQNRRKHDKQGAGNIKSRRDGLERDDMKVDGVGQAPKGEIVVTTRSGRRSVKPVNGYAAL